MALSVMGDEVKFTDGKISSKTGFQGDITTYQISVPVQPGNSGGPLFDYDGNIIGIVSAKIMAADNVSYAIKSSYLRNLLDVLPESINIPNDQALSSITLTEKIKLLSDYVVLIKIK
jgi:S1-C subfamily serine protease